MSVGTVSEQLSKLAILPSPHKDDMPYRISLDVVRFHLRSVRLPLPECLETPVGIPTAEMMKMRFLQDEFRRLYSASYTTDSAPLTHSQAYPYFMAVLEETFSDGIINWGRVVGVYFFGTEFARQLVEAGPAELVGSVVEWVASYIETFLLDWMNEHGGWPAFLDNFRDPHECDCPIM